MSIFSSLERHCLTYFKASDTLESFLSKVALEVSFERKLARVS